MCGRYASSKDTDGLVEAFEIDEVVAPAPPPSFNVAPTDPVPIVVTRPADGTASRELRTARWGLVPSWAKDLSVGARMINARWESLAGKPAFRKAFAARRCLLPADGYYEWYRPPGSGPKQPFFIHRVDGRPLAMAGLFELWRADPSSQWLLSASVITMPASPELAHLHDRMPALVPAEEWDEWLAPQVEFSGTAPTLGAGLLAAYPVSSAVNKVGNDGPQLCAPLPTG
ncbi:MAG: SOS response-associated peptidase [Candidatus Nanopelagicales bacterium]